MRDKFMSLAPVLRMLSMPRSMAGDRERMMLLICSIFDTFTVTLSSFGGARPVGVACTPSPQIPLANIADL